jgi:hypothetical protein
MTKWVKRTVWVRKSAALPVKKKKKKAMGNPWGAPAFKMPKWKF